MRLDFSQFHDQMHPPFTRHCRSLYPHGWRSGFHHLALAWRYRYRDALRTPLHTLLLCPRGRHDIQLWYSRPADDGPTTVQAICSFCPHERPPTTAERENMPPFLTSRTD